MTRPELVEYVRTLVQGDREGNGRAASRLDQTAWQDFPQYIAALFAVAVSLRFGDTADRGEIAGFVGTLGTDAGTDAAALPAGAAVDLIASAIEPAGGHGVEPEAVGRIQGAVVYRILAEAHAAGIDVDALLGQATELAAGTSTPDESRGDGEHDHEQPDHAEVTADGAGAEPADLVRALARRDWPTVERLVSDAGVLQRRDSVQLLNTAFGIMVHRRFRPDGDLREISRFVAAARSRCAQVAELPALQMEGLIRAALGETELMDGVSAEVWLPSLVVILGTLLQDADLSPAALDDFLAETERAVAQHL